MAKLPKQRAAEWRKRHPEKNRQVWIKSNADSRRRYNNLKINVIKERKGCQICGYNDLSCLGVYEFHHISEEKEGNISRFRRTINKTNLIDEIKKCIIVCANCHRKVHWTKGIITDVS